MTLTNLIETGSGKLAARWKIEGLPIEFVTDPDMEQTLADGRRRVCCTTLQDCGFTIEEEVNLPEALLEGSGTNLRLAETLDEDLAAVFHHRPDVELFGNTTVDSSDTSITGLYSTTGVSAGDVIHVGNEAMLVNSVAATSIDVTGGRGHWDTTAQSHYSIDTAGTPELVVTNRPLRIRGRLVSLYLYGVADGLAGNGALVWQGHVRAEPALVDNGNRYHLSLGHIGERLKTKIGGDLDVPIRPAGIYYPWSAALRIQIHENGSLRVATDKFTGHYDTQEAFVSALTTWLQTPGDSDIADGGLDSTYTAEVTPDGRWTIRVTVGASTTGVAVHCWSEQDGQTSIRAENMLVDSPDGEALGFSTISAGQYLYAAWTTGPAGARTVPRGFFGISDETRLHVGADAADAPETRIHVNRPFDADWGAVQIEWSDASSSGSSTGGPYALLNSADDYIGIDRTYVAGEKHAYTTANLPTIRIMRLHARGNLSDFIEVVKSDSPDDANLNILPLLTSRELASWNATVSAAAVFHWQRRRVYAFAESHDFEELISHELRLLGLFPITDSDGKIALASLSLPTSTTSTAFDIDEEVVEVDGQAVEWSSMSRGNQTVNRVELTIRENTFEGDRESPLSVQDRTAFAFDHEDRPLKIAPKAHPNDPRVDPLDVADAALPVLSVFAYPHDFVSVKVTWKAFDVRLGDVVSFEAEHLPSHLVGERPISSVRALVVGRRWAIDEIHGELKLLISWQNLAGYAPTARVSSQNNTAGDTWDLTIDTTLYANSGDDPTNHFAAGDVVRIMQVDSESATVVGGTVDSVSTPTITVTFDSTWTPGSDTWDLIFGTYTNTSDDQHDYAFIAGLDLLLGVSDSPRTLGP